MVDVSLEGRDELCSAPAGELGAEHAVLNVVGVGLARLEDPAQTLRIPDVVADEDEPPHRVSIG